MIENIQLASQSLWSHKLRSFLAILGILIGITLIISVISTIEGSNRQIEQSLIGSGTNAVTVQLCQDGSEYYTQWYGIPQGVSVISDDTMQQLRELRHVEAAARFCSRDGYETAFYKDSEYTGEIFGVDDSYFDAAGYSLGYGRLFTGADGENFRKVVILDEQAASTLFGDEFPLGKILEIKGEPFTVIGVVRQAASDIKADTPYSYEQYADTGSGKIFVPLADWPMIYVFDEPQNVVLRAETTDDMTSVGKAAATLLTDSQISGNSSMTYESKDLKKMAESLQSLNDTANMQKIIMSVISLVVGAIGVANIMLVSVTERTREIGLKKALGARKKSILRQFLTEAVVLTGFGGFIGILVGIGVSKISSLVTGAPAYISPAICIIAFLGSMIIGIAAGMMPAVKAANLNPIEALRRE